MMNVKVAGSIAIADFLHTTLTYNRISDVYFKIKTHLSETKMAVMKTKMPIIETIIAIIETLIAKMNSKF